jgi:glycosyltransferase involved in cell wall biosynthesis
MVLVDAVYINNSGGKILLDYLILQLEKTDIEIYYLLDKRIENRHPEIKAANRVEYLKGGLISKHQFYKKRGNTFQKVLCFGNFPPDIRLKGTVFTYFHQLLFINAPSVLPFITRFLIKLKTVIFSLTAGNSDFWLVQSGEVKASLCKKYKAIPASKVLVIPFYPPLRPDGSITRKKGSFLYVSSGHSYKNHENLLEAFILFFDKYRIGELHLTIGDDFVKLQNRIGSLQQLGYPVINHGFVGRENLAVIYNSVDFVIYPSIAESFGLGIVEAIENGCKVIGSNLPWLHAVCEPSLVFDPESVESINLAIKDAVFNEVNPSKQLVFDQVGELIDLLK